MGKLTAYTNASNTTTWNVFNMKPDGTVGFGIHPDDMTGGKVNVKRDGGDWIRLYRTQDAGYWSIHNGNTNQTHLAFHFTPASGPVLLNRLVLHNDGKVSIGTTNCPGSYGLYVANGILTEKVKVALISSAQWADYVFAPEYELMSISEVKDFIDCNGHLPSVPSADEIVDKGVDVAQMDALLLKKIEELTLYIIQLKKELDELKGYKN